jgi:hypothetical protein
VISYWGVEHGDEVSKAWNPASLKGLNRSAKHAKTLLHNVGAQNRRSLFRQLDAESAYNRGDKATGLKYAKQSYRADINSSRSDTAAHNKINTMQGQARRARNASFVEGAALGGGMAGAATLYHKKKVQKSYDGGNMISYWGVDHGSEVSKAWNQNDRKPSERTGYHRPTMMNSAGENAKMGAKSGAASLGVTGAALGAAFGGRGFGARAKAAGVLGGAGAAIGAPYGAALGAVSPSKNTKNAKQFVAHADRVWENKQKLKAARKKARGNYRAANQKSVKQFYREI